MRIQAKAGEDLIFYEFYWEEEACRMEGAKLLKIYFNIVGKIRCCASHLRRVKSFPDLYENSSILLPATVVTLS